MPTPNALRFQAVWDTDKMEIVRRFGIAGLMVGGGAAVAGGLPANALQQPEQ